MSDIISTLQSINAGSFKDALERKTAAMEVQALLSRIEAPSDTAFRLALSIPPQMAALKTALDMGLFQKWIQKNEGRKLKLEELNKLVDCNASLFKRLIQHLTSTNMLWTDTAGLYEMTPFTISLIKDNQAACVNFFFQLGMPVALNLPAFFGSIGYRDVASTDMDGFKHWCGKSAWEYLAANPEAAATLGQYMTATSLWRGNFSETFPCEELSCGKDEPLLVDVGGSLGHDIQAFKTRHPNAVGKFILQDQPDVIERAKNNASLDPSVEKQAYDFFTPQTVKDAKIYYLHAILHDWPDVDAKRILENLKPAMKRGHSKLLIHEVVMQTQNPNMEETARDLSMLMLANGMERSEEQWKDLLDSAGFKINKIWRNSLYCEAIIETEVV